MSIATNDAQVLLLKAEEENALEDEKIVINAFKKSVRNIENKQTSLAMAKEMYDKSVNDHDTLKKDVASGKFWDEIKRSIDMSSYDRSMASGTYSGTIYSDN